MSSLECRNISKSYGAVKALQNVSITIGAGEVRAILGGNGSGKSTFSKILGGSVFANAGQVFFGGELLRLSSPVEAKWNGIVITSQELSLLDNLSVEENLLLCGIPRKSVFIDRRRLHSEAVAMLERVGLAEFARGPISRLAPNQLYLLEFAKALIQKPKVLVIDEITSALYREDVALVKDIVFGLRKEGCRTLFVSHRMNEIFDICDTVTVLRNGENVGDLSLAGAHEDQLLAMMSGQDVQKAVRMKAAYEPGAGEGGRFLSVRGLRLENFPGEIDFDVAKGEIVGIAGLQGNGQSGLVRTLFALNGGLTLEMDGENVAVPNPRVAVRRGIAFVSGDREREGTFAIRSLLENAGAVTDLVLGKPNREKEQTLREYGVAMHSPRQPIRTLSGGNQQKVVLSRWTAATPSLLLADDPTKGIDVNARREVHQVIRSLAGTGAGVLFVSSDSKELVELTRLYTNARVVIMYRGQIVHTLRGDEITAENIAYHEVPRRVEA